MLLGTSHRRPPVRGLVGAIRQGLGRLYDLPAGYEVLLGVGGTTAFWDAAAFCLVERRSQHLAFGEFSSKFAAVTAGAPHLAAPDVIESEAGTHPEAVPNADVDTYALTHNETSTGVVMSIIRPPGADGLVLVDATSAAGAIEVDTGEFDVYYFAPQKAFGSEGGLWIALCSPAALARIERMTASDRWVPPFLDLATALENSRKDQTYNTPSIATLFLMARQVDWLLDMGGLAWAATRCATTSGVLYAWAEASQYATPYVAKPDDRSPTVATIDLDAAVSAEVVSGVLRANGIVDIDSYRKLGRNQLRIAAFPNIEPADAETLTAAIDHVAARL